MGRDGREKGITLQGVGDNIIIIIVVIIIIIYLYTRFK